VRARRRFGQHFLEAAWAERLVAAADLSPADHVVEIGPGRGALTFPLSKRVARVTAVELDRDLVAWWETQTPANVAVIEGDFLDVPPETLYARHGDEPIRVVGNLPYNVSTPMLFRLLELARAGGRLRDATLMLQREVADRIAGSRGTKAYGVLAVMIQLEADVRPLLQLPPGAFRPRPKVSSTVVRLTFRPPSVAIADRDRFGAMLRSLFASRRKTMGNACRSLVAASGLDAKTLLSAIGIDSQRRPETLDVAEFARLAAALRPAEGRASAPEPVV
jgi:16S rRNA (adenine1518-N6/adenine1519-N6)-dimethyltransferase